MSLWNLQATGKVTVRWKSPCEHPKASLNLTQDLSRRCYLMCICSPVNMYHWSYKCHLSCNYPTPITMPCLPLTRIAVFVSRDSFDSKPSEIRGALRFVDSPAKGSPQLTKRKGNGVGQIQQCFKFNVFSICRVWMGVWTSIWYILVPQVPARFWVSTTDCRVWWLMDVLTVVRSGHLLPWCWWWWRTSAGVQPSRRRGPWQKRGRFNG